jgi:hypothetical protein
MPPIDHRQITLRDSIYKPVIVFLIITRKRNPDTNSATKRSHREMYVELDAPTVHLVYLLIRILWTNSLRYVTLVDGVRFTTH